MCTIFGMWAGELEVAFGQSTVHETKIWANVGTPNIWKAGSTKRESRSKCLDSSLRTRARGLVGESSQWKEHSPRNRLIRWTNHLNIRNPLHLPSDNNEALLPFKCLSKSMILWPPQNRCVHFLLCWDLRWTVWHCAVFNPWRVYRSFWNIVMNEILPSELLCSILVAVQMESTWDCWILKQQANRWSGIPANNPSLTDSC